MIPAYQAEDWIADAIHSARAQTWPNKEIIVVDDGSTDGTLRVASRFSSNAVKVVSQPNQGACAARNKAFSLCQGDYIQWLDADDLLAPDKIAKQFEKIDRCRSKTTLLCSAWGRCYYRSEKAKFTPTPLWQDLQPVEWLIRKYENNLWMSPESWLVSRELSEAAGPWDIRLLRNNDGEYFDRVVCASDGIRFVPEARSYLRTVNFHSISSDLHLSEQKLESMFLSLALGIGYLRALEDSERTRAACLKQLKASLIYFYAETPEVVEKVGKLAKELGGKLGVPELSWKYSMIQRAFGWKVAKKAQRAAAKAKTGFLMRWDRLQQFKPLVDREPPVEKVSESVLSI